MKQKIYIAIAGLLAAVLLMGAGVIGYQDWQLRGSAPGNPASGFLRIWADSTAGYFKCLTSAGAVCHFEGTASSSIKGIIQPDGNAAHYVDGTGAWSTPAGSGGALTLLESHTASSSTELDFTSSLSSTYDDYLIEVIGFIPATNGAAPLLQFSTNGGSSYDTTSIYDWSDTINAMGSGSPGGNGQSSVNGIVIFSDSSRVGLLSTGTPAMVATFKLFDPLNASNYKIVSGDGLGQYSGSSARYAFTFAGVYRSATAVNAFRIIMSSGNIASGTVRVYGVSH